MAHTGLFSNRQLAVVPPAGAAHDVHIEGEKTEQKAIQRRTVDPLGPYIHMLQERALHWDHFRFKPMIPTAAAGLRLLPPVGYLSQPATSYATKFAQTSTSKVRCSIDSVAWTPDSKRCLTGSHRGEFTLWNGTTFRFEGILQAHESAITSMVHTHNENWLATADLSGRVKYWKGRNELVKDFEAHRECVRGVSFAPSDLKFVTGSADSTLKVWDFRTCQADQTLAGHARDVLSCDWHPSWSVVASSSRDYTIRLWDPRVGGEALSSLEGHMNEVTRVQWHAGGQLLLSAGRDSQLKLWDTRAMRELTSFTGAKAPINCAAWHPVHEDVFVSGSHDGTLLYWLASRQGQQAEVAGAHEGPVWSLAWSPLGHCLATGGSDHCVRFWARARPGDAWRDKGRSEQEGAGGGGSAGAAVRQPASQSLLSGGIPGLADSIPGLPGLPEPAAGGTAALGPTWAALPAPPAQQQQPPPPPPPGGRRRRDEPDPRVRTDHKRPRVMRP